MESCTCRHVGPSLGPSMRWQQSRCPTAAPGLWLAGQRITARTPMKIAHTTPPTPQPEIPPPAERPPTPEPPPPEIGDPLPAENPVPVHEPPGMPPPQIADPPR